MAKSMSELKLRRFRWGIPRRELARTLNCSDSWLRQLESGAAQGPVAAREWRQRYEAALDRLIAEKKAAQ